MKILDSGCRYYGLAEGRGLKLTIKYRVDLRVKVASHTTVC